MFKTFFHIFLLFLIFVKISSINGKNCKYFGEKNFFQRRHKRGNCISFPSCVERGDGSRESRKEHFEVNQVDRDFEIGQDLGGRFYEGESSGGGYGERQGGGQARKVLYICNNFFYSHVQFNVLILFK